MSIWKRYFISQTLKTFFLFLFCFYGLYVLVDVAAHASSYHHHIKFRWSETVFYYACEFLKRADVLVPFGLLLATIKTLCSLNTNNELVALLASGKSLQKLLTPFVGIGLVLTFLLYINVEFIQPKALEVIRHIDDKHHSQKIKKKEIPSVQHLVLEDDSTILFQSFNTSLQHFADLYWIRSADDIYRIKYLYPYTESPVGEFVDHFTRNANGKLIKKESFDIQIFPEIKFNTATLMETLTPPKDLSLSDLKNKFPNEKKISSEKHSQVMSIFYYKMALPWLCLLAVIGPAPFCVYYTRQLPVFLIYALSIFGFVAIYLILDAALILGERQVVPPFESIFVPFTFFFALFGLKFLQLRKGFS